MNGFAGPTLVALLGSAAGMFPTLFRNDVSILVVSRGIVFGAGMLLTLFGIGGFVGRIPAAIRLQEVDGELGEFRRELRDLLVFGSSMIAGIGLLVLVLALQVG